MPFTQKDRPLRVNTPLGADKFLISDFSGKEALSELFQFNLQLLAENTVKVDFDKLIGQPIMVELDITGGKKRYFSGICNRFSEGRRDDVFTYYRMEIVPQLWLLTRRKDSRTFQQITVPDILKKVLKGLDVKWDIKGKFEPRDYCVQYRESDFAFASRLMEEEGIYYYFAHSEKGHQMVVSNTPQGHADVPVATALLFDNAAGGNRPEMRVFDWEKIQELRSGKVTLWDNCFELPQQNLEAQKTIQESVKVGKVEHKLKVADNDKLELYDYPGLYAQRFDGIDPGGAARPDDLKKIFEDNGRTAKLHIEREAAASIEIRGQSDCRQLTAGHKFTLEKHFNADGPYVLTSVTHAAHMGVHDRTGVAEELRYENRFTCIPLPLPYRPQINTPRQTVAGTQTATVVGAPGEAIFCDKYGRVKVQFHWDREGKKDANSSCWVRVSQNWGGAGWGNMTIPHVGQEVIVDFEEGDPDRPLIVGRVYNAECMPPLTLPGHKTKTVFRDHGGNQIFMEGDEGKESICISSPCGGTSISMGFSPPSIAPIGAGPREDIDKKMAELNPAPPPDSAAAAALKQQISALAGSIQPQPRILMNPSTLVPSPEGLNAVLNVFSQGQFNSHIQGNYDTFTGGDHQSYYSGKSKNVYASDLYTECWTNNDTIVHGNYTCRVNGYQEYFTKGHYVTKVLGFNWVTIVGADTDIYLSSQQAMNIGLHFNLYVNVRLQYEKAWAFYKSPKKKYLEGTEQKQVGENMQKIGNDAKKVAGELREKAKKMWEESETKQSIVAGLMRAEADKHELKAKKLEQIGDKILDKAGKIVADGETTINNALKISK